MKHHLYLGNKMMNCEEFNAPWFDGAEQELMALPIVEAVFNPARHDRLVLGFNPSGKHGTHEELARAHFDRRQALRADWNWIADCSTGMIAGPDWRTSPGTVSEIGCHQALYLPVWEFQDFMRFWDRPGELDSLILGPLTPLWP